MKKLLKIVLVSSLSLLCFSCYYDEEFVPVIDLDENEPIKFSTDIIPIFTNFGCANCHDGGQDPDLTPGKEYNSLKAGYIIVGDGANSEIYKKLDDGHQQYNNALELAKLELWIDQGALNN